MIVSLDGYIAGPNGELDWFDGPNPQFDRYCDEMIDGVDTAIYGRRSYEQMVAYWPRADGAFARKINALPKLVLSRTLEQATWSHTRVVRDVDQIAALKREEGKPIVAWAGASLVASLEDAGLVDEYRLVVQPVLLGGGTRLFRSRDRRVKLRQVRTLSLDGRVTVLCFEPTA